MITETVRSSSRNSSRDTFCSLASQTITKPMASWKRASLKSQMAEETLALEIDRVERLEGMNKITIQTYPSYTLGVSILQTT